MRALLQNLFTTGGSRFELFFAAAGVTRESAWLPNCLGQINLVVYCVSYDHPFLKPVLCFHEQMFQSPKRRGGIYRSHFQELGL